MKIFSFFITFTIPKSILKTGSDKKFIDLVDSLSSWVLLHFVCQKIKRGCVLNFRLEHKITNLLCFLHNKTQEERESTKSINHLI